MGLKRVMEDESIEGNSLAAYMLKPIFKKLKAESVEGKPMRCNLQEVQSLLRVLESESIAGNSLAADMLDLLNQGMEQIRIEGSSLAADMPKYLIQGMEHLRIEGSSLAADMPELNKSTKAAQEAHLDNKNEEEEEKEKALLDKWVEESISFDLSYYTEMPNIDHFVLLDVDED